MFDAFAYIIAREGYRPIDLISQVAAPATYVEHRVVGAIRELS